VTHNVQRKRLLLIVLGFVVVGGLGLFLWARAALTGDAVRHAVEAQLSKVLGEPVTIGSVSATILPRVTMNLNDVAIGSPQRIAIRRLDVGTNFRALLSRRIEHATVRVADARIELPLPAFAIAQAVTVPAGEPAPGGAPVEIVSVDAIELTGVEIVSGGRSLRGSVEVVPAGNGLDVRRVALAADGTSLDITGRIEDLAGPTGELSVKAGGINVLELLSFITDFTKGAGFGEATTGTGPARPAAVPMNLAVSVEADRAVVGTLALEALSGTARLTPDVVTLEPVKFGVFGGTYTGTLAWRLGATPGFTLDAALSGVDAAAAMAFAGSSNAMTGRLSGRMALSGRGMTVDQVMASARGTARIDVKDGSVANLGLVRTVVLAGSMRRDSQAAVSGARLAASEPFSELGATFAVGDGMARTTDLRFTSPDVLMTALGSIRFRGAVVDLVGQVQLSEALTKQAGRDLARYTQVGGRVTVPVTVKGSAGNLSVGLDVGEAARRAIANRAAEEAKKLLKRIIKAGARS